MTQPPAETYVVTLTPTGPGPPPIHRLRSALKTLLRAHGLRCVKVTASKPEDATPPSTETPTP